MKKHFTKVLCSLLLFATINPATSLAQDNPFRLSNQQPKEMESPIYNTRDNNWYSYDDNKFIDAVGGPQKFSWGVMFPSTMFSEGQNITKVSFYDYAASTGDISICYGGTSSPEMPIHKQPYSTKGTEKFVEFDLTAPLPLFGDNLWIILSTNEGDAFPAAICEDNGDPNSRWLSIDGITWVDLNKATEGIIKGSWMIRAYIEGGESINELNSLLNIYPNPAKDQLFIETEVEVEEVSIFDVYGRRQQTTINGQQTLSIDVSNLSNGVYFVKVKSKNNEVIKRFIKK